MLVFTCPVCGTGPASVDDSASMSTHPRLPNLIIPGVAKAGTTSLHDYLGQHPDICAARIKEVNFFTDGGNPAGREGLDRYERFFSHCAGQRYRVESSPAYFYGGEGVIAALQETLAGPRIIISLREPAIRLWSAFTFLQSMGRLPPERSFAEYVTWCRGQYDSGGSTTPYALSLYGERLPAWM
jgi:hypothetical protein